MSKDSKETVKKALSERLTNAEFSALIPHMKLEELCMTQVKGPHRWVPIFVHLPRSKAVKCNSCKVKCPKVNFLNHLKSPNHIRALCNVHQFYHPVYTYPKESVKLARGESVPEDVKKAAVEEAKLKLVETKKSEWTFARRISRLLQENSRSNLSRFEEVLIRVALESKVSTAANMIVEVSLPLNKLLKLQFSKKSGYWCPLLTTKNPIPSGKFRCTICEKYCAGIITVNSHLNGFRHRNLQLQTLGMRLEGLDYITKACCYRYDKKFSINVTRSGRDRLKQKAQQVMTKGEDLHWAPLNLTSIKEEEDDGNDTGLIDTNDGADEDNDEASEIEEGFETFGMKDEDDGDEIDQNMEENSNDVQMVDDDNNVGNDHKSSSAAGGSLSSMNLPENIVAKVKALSSQKPEAANINITKDNEDLIDKEGLIGVEYVVKLLKSSNDPAPDYECCLCEILLNEARMQGHLISYEHRLKYCEMHYPHTMQRYKERIGHKKYAIYNRIMKYTLSRVAIAIENHHGRSIPYSVSLTKYTKLRPQVVTKLYGFKHACEGHGPNFLNIVSTEDMKLYVKYKTPIVPENHRGRFTTQPTKMYLNMQHHDPKNRGREDFDIVKEFEPKFKHSNRPKGRDIWKEYREEISRAASVVENQYVEYRKYPESHPLYDNEWNRFWRQRKGELIAQGVDHRTHNYQPEWIVYFKARLEELFSEELEKSKIDVRVRLNIPLDAPEDTKLSKTSNASDAQSRKRSYPESDASKNIQPLMKVYCPPVLPVHSVHQVHSVHPVHTVHSEHPVRETRVSPPRQSLSPIVKRDAAPLIPVADEKPNVIHALRLLTALEEHLGSLGGKIMDLLSKALVLEKTCSDGVEVDRKILNLSNCSVLEMAVEKLKGILFAGLLSDSKIQGFNRVINNTTGLLKHAEKMGWSREVIDDYAEKTSNSGSVGGGVGGGVSGSGSGSSEIQKLLEVLQSKQSNDGPSVSAQTSLSDTLMQLISSRKNDNSDNRQSEQSYNPMNYGSMSKRNDDSNASGSSSMSNLHYGSPNEMNRESNFSNFNRNNSNNNMSSNPDKGFSGNISQFNMRKNFDNNNINNASRSANTVSNFGSNLMQNTNSGFGDFGNSRSGGSSSGGGGGGGVSGGSGTGRNNFNNNQMYNKVNNANNNSNPMSSYGQSNSNLYGGSGSGVSGGSSGTGGGGRGGSGVSGNVGRSSGGGSGSGGGGSNVGNSGGNQGFGSYGQSNFGNSQMPNRGMNYQPNSMANRNANGNRFPNNNNNNNTGNQNWGFGNR